MKRAILAAALIVIAASAFGDCPAAEKRTLEQLDKSWTEASRKGDRAALQQIYADDYMSTGAGNLQNKSQTIDATVSDAERARSAPPQPQTVADYYVIHCTPTTAVITHRNTTAGSKGPTYSRSVHVLEKRGGRWQVVTNAGHPLSDAAAISYLEHEWNDADVKSDLTWFERNLADDYSGLSSRTGKIGRKSDHVGDMRTRKTTTTSAELTDLTTRTQGDTVVVTGVNHVRGQGEDGKPYTRKVAFTDVWVKRDGRWQVRRRRDASAGLNLPR